MTLIQLLTVLFVAFAGSRVILRFYDKEIGYGGLSFWSGVWTLVLLVVFQPNIADRTATFFGIRQGADAMFFFAIILLFYLIFRLYIKLEKIDASINLLAENTSKELHRQKQKSEKV